MKSYALVRVKRIKSCTKVSLQFFTSCCAVTGARRYRAGVFRGCDAARFHGGVERLVGSTGLTRCCKTAWSKTDPCIDTAHPTRKFIGNPLAHNGFRILRWIGLRTVPTTLGLSEPICAGQEGRLRRTRRAPEYAWRETSGHPARSEMHGR